MKVLIKTYWLFLMVMFQYSVQAQISPKGAKAATDQFHKGGDPHVLALFTFHLEGHIEKADEKTKLAGIKQVLDFAIMIYETRDLSVSVNRSIGIWPDFDATQYGEKPIFLGAENPTKFFTNPKAKEAYNQAVITHKELLSKTNAEKYKMQEGDYCTQVAARTLLTSTDQVALSSQVKEYINSMSSALWIKQHLLSIVFPQVVAEPVQQKSQSAPAIKPEK